MISLYMGYPFDPTIEKKIESLPLKLREIYLGGGDYLEKIVYNEKLYLGKLVKEFPKWDEIHNIQKNLVSLLQRFLPTYPFNADQIIIFSNYGKFNS